MKHSSADVPIACCWTSTQPPERAALPAQFGSAVIGTEEVREGYGFGVPPIANGVR
jgi:hypothetical protein